MKKILGIDPGTKITGWGIITFQNNRYSLIDCGTILPNPKVPLEQKYLHIYDELTSIIQIHTPDTLSIESQFMDKNFQSVSLIAMARAIAYLAAAKQNLPIFEYAPTKAKKAVTGKGNATKAAVAHMVKILLKLPPHPLAEDTTDALALAITHAHFSTRPKI